MQIDIGIDANHREEIAKGLSRVLADTYTLYLKTHNFHWNVKGPMFTALHTMFETQYTELALAVDEIAERIRSVGHTAPGTYSAFARLSAVEETDGVPKATEMIEILVEDHEKVAEVARALIEVAGEAGDDASEDLAVRRIEVHEKSAWMLRAHLE